MVFPGITLKVPLDIPQGFQVSAIEHIALFQIFLKNKSFFFVNAHLNFHLINSYIDIMLPAEYAQLLFQNLSRENSQNKSGAICTGISTENYSFVSLGMQS